MVFTNAIREHAAFVSRPLASETKNKTVLCEAGKCTTYTREL